jgi:hypothetical protein
MSAEQQEQYGCPACFQKESKGVSGPFMAALPALTTLCGRRKIIEKESQAGADGKSWLNRCSHE